MKLKSFAFFVISIICIQEGRAQYKDLEGVFFGKVVGLGVGGTANIYKDKSIGTVSSVTPITYSVILNSKKITAIRIALHKKLTATYEGNDGFTDYTQTLSHKFFEFEYSYKFAITPDGFDKPTSLFINLQAGGLFGKGTINDSRYGESEGSHSGASFIGAGLTLYQRLGSRFLFFAEPGYRYQISAKEYIGDGERKVVYNNINVHAGLMFLLGKSN